MPCFYPAPCFECVNTQTGQIFFKLKVPSPGAHYLKVINEFKRRCGQCSGCRTRSIHEWGVRAYHESLDHDHSCFITLTVDSKYLELVFPKGNLKYDEFQKFMRRLRKKVKNKLRFIMCAEYGDRFERPHYHGIIFGFNPMSQYRGDTEVIKRSPNGDLYSSRILSEVWEFGYSSVGNFDIGCANYVAGYIRKKINGRLKDAWYKGHTQEFAKMSLKPGIGFNFYKKYTGDMYRRDKVVLPGGSEMPIPHYYDTQHSFFHPSHMEKVKAKRLLPNPARDLLNQPERLAARKVIIERRNQDLRRNYDQGGLL